VGYQIIKPTASVYHKKEITQKMSLVCVGVDVVDICQNVPRRDPASVPTPDGVFSFLLEGS